MALPGRIVPLAGMTVLWLFPARQDGSVLPAAREEWSRPPPTKVDHVIPLVPVRQWVLSLPKRLRYFLAHDPKIAGGVLRVFLHAVERFLRKVAADGGKKTKFGAIGFLHRFGSAINVHYHSVVTDGVFEEEPGGGVAFREAPSLDRPALVVLQDRVRRRVLAYLQRRGCLSADFGHRDAGLGARRRLLGGCLGQDRRLRSPGTGTDL